jgi:signal transduction histidine kinase
MRWPRFIACCLAAVTLAMAAVTCALLAVHRIDHRTTVLFLSVAAVGLLIVALGVAVTWRVRRNPVGPLLAWFGANAVYITARLVYYRIWLADHHAVPLDTKVVAILDESGWWLLASAALLLLYFPDGQIPSRRLRWLPLGIVTTSATTQVGGAFTTEPFLTPMQHLARPWPPLPAPLDALAGAANLALVAMVFTCGGSLVLRFRRSSGRERAQLRWLALAGIAAVAYPLVCLTEIAITGKTGPLSVAVALFALVSLPLSIAVAMLRHDLYDIDRVLADAVSYLVVVAALVAAYAVTVLSLGLIIGRHSAAAAAAATAICALLLAPLRTRLRRAVDRRLFPPRRAALQAIEDLQQRVHTQDAQPEELESVLRTALRDPHLRVGMLVPGRPGFVDAFGVQVPDRGLVPVTLGGVQIGVLSGSAATGPGVLRVVASACASLVEVTRLRAELANALREVEASRARVIQVGDAERRRLERDLHDGAQQRLVSLGMALRLAQRRLSHGGVDVNDLLDQSVAELATAIAELRQIAHGLRPTSLDDGLHAALSALTSKLPIPVHLDVVPEPLDDEVATTAYFVAAEAITNAAKHANASAINVRVAHSSAGVEVKVQDDGIGGAASRAGSGLAGLADRVAAIGGSLIMASPEGSGTTIQAVLPCGS